MEFVAVAVLFSVVVYCLTMLYTQDVNMKLHRKEEIKRLKEENRRLKERLKAYESE